jgi:uncharacterized membrane protein
MRFKGLSLLGSLGLGALFAYLLDPRMGRRRRAFISDKIGRFRHEASDAVGVTSRDLKNRLGGTVAESRTLFKERDRFDAMKTNWSPSTRFIAGTLGATTALWGARQLGLLGSAVATLGTAILTRAATNMEFKRLFGIGAGRNAVTICKTINIAATPEVVFAFWSNYENLPRFMSNVRNVRRTSENRSHWVVAGPAGVPVEWDAIMTHYEVNELLSWKTISDSPIQHNGTVRFEPNEHGGTRLDVRMSYNPIAGGIGHAVAALFRADPKSVMDEDLGRMKTMIETGTPPHDAAQKNEAEQSGSEPKAQAPEETFDKTLADSFPTSDPPSWNMGKEPT